MNGVKSLIWLNFFFNFDLLNGIAIDAWDWPRSNEIVNEIMVFKIFLKKKLFLFVAN